MDNVDQAIDMLLEGTKEASDFMTRIVSMAADAKRLSGKIQDETRGEAMSERTQMVAVFTVDGLPAYQFGVKQIVNNFHVDDHELDIHVVSKNGSASGASELFFNELIDRGLVEPDAELDLKPWG